MSWVRRKSRQFPQLFPLSLRWILTNSFLLKKSPVACTPTCRGCVRRFAAVVQTRCQFSTLVGTLCSIGRKLLSGFVNRRVRYTPHIAVAQGRRHERLTSFVHDGRSLSCCGLYTRDYSWLSTWSESEMFMSGSFRCLIGENDKGGLVPPLLDCLVLCFDFLKGCTHTLQGRLDVMPTSYALR